MLKLTYRCFKKHASREWLQRRSFVLFMKTKFFEQLKTWLTISLNNITLNFPSIQKKILFQIFTVVLLHNIICHLIENILFEDFI